MFSFLVSVPTGSGPWSVCGLTGKAVPSLGLKMPEWTLAINLNAVLETILPPHMSSWRFIIIHGETSAFVFTFFQTEKEFMLDEF